MSVDILGTNCDQTSMVQHCFTSTKTIRLVRTESPERPPRLSHSSWTVGSEGAVMLEFVMEADEDDNRLSLCARWFKHGFFKSTQRKFFLRIFCLDNEESRNLFTAVASQNLYYVLVSRVICYRKGYKKYNKKYNNNKILQKTNKQTNKKQNKKSVKNESSKQINTWNETDRQTDRQEERRTETEVIRKRCFTRTE